MKNKKTGTKKGAFRWLAMVFVLGLALIAVNPAQADKKDPPPTPPPVESKAPDTDKRDEKEEREEKQEHVSAGQQQVIIDDCPEVVMAGDPACDDDTDIPVEGQESPYTGESTDPELDEIEAFGGAIDPLEGFLAWVESSGSDVLADCGGFTCDDGDEIFDAADLLAEIAELDLCLLGLCAVDPAEEVEDASDEPGELDNCQLSVTCETGDDSEGQTSSDADDPSSEVCEQEEDGDEDCEDDTEGQYTGEHYETGDSPASEHESSSTGICSQGKGADVEGAESCNDNSRGQYTGEHYEAHDPTDSDHDGLPDETEKNMGTDPYNGDSDNDGLPDGIEVGAVPNPFYDGEWTSDPLDGDSDDDGFGDLVESFFGGDPYNDDSETMCDVLELYDLEPAGCHDW